ncbi:MAG TPA: hypothetical protein ENG00_00570 [Candidatus Aenigmarchaeota archaeon]|nr:hypothetical protein [Candidatus Aenigmarchaeota archaeon]
MILMTLGVIDIVAGIILTLHGIPAFRGSGFILTYGAVILLKGIWSYLSSASKGIYFDFLGVLDMVAGVFMILLCFGITYDFFVLAGIALAVKGVYSFIIDMVT